MTRRTSRFLTRPAALAAGGALAVVLAACGGAAPQTQADAYSLTTKAFDASWDQFTVKLGVAGTAEGKSVSIAPDSLAVSVDTKAGKGAVHVSLPTSVMGDDAKSLAQFGVTGDTLDVDVVFDGQGLYAKSPVAATLLPMLMAQTGTPISGDLTGWIKLGTKEEFTALFGALGGSLPIPSASQNPADELSALDAAALKQKLDESGITLTFVGTEQRNGVTANHLTLAVDPAKFASSDLAKDVPADQLSSFTTAAGEVSLSGDLWLDQASGRPAELDLHIADTKTSDKADVTVLVNTPEASAFATPDGATEVPIAPLLQQMAPLLGAGLMGG